MNEPLAQPLVDDDLELEDPVEASAPVAEEVNLDDPSLYLNRELTWLDFNRRVLHEADDVRTPLLERVKFLAIVSNNLDEFFMKRIGGLKQQIAAGVHTPSLDGRTPTEQLKLCQVTVRGMHAEQKRLFDELIRLLAERDIRITKVADLPAEGRERLRDYFRSNIFPMLTPLAMDPAHPFPFISNLALNLLVTLRFPGGSEIYMARVKVPVSRDVSKRFIPVDGTNTFVTLEDLMAANLDMLFPGMEIDSAELFRVTRNAIVEPSEEAANDLLELIETELRERHFAPIVRLEVQEGTDPVHRGMLAAELGLERGAGRLRGQGHDAAARPLRDRRARLPGPQGPAPPPGGPPPAGQRPAQHLPHHPRERAHPAPAPLPALQHLGGALPAHRRGGPQGAGHQDDPLPHLRRGHPRLPDRGRPQRQAGGGAGGAQGALRRGRQHPLGAPPGGRGHPCQLRRPGAQDPQQADLRGAP